MKPQLQLPKVLLSLFLFASCAEIVPNNAQEDLITSSDSDFDTSLYGGQNPNKAAPGFIFLIYASQSRTCHGTRIHRDFVITAAHCFKRSDKASEVTLARLDSQNKITRFRNSVNQIAIHPNYETRAAEVAKAEERKRNGQTVLLPEIYNHSDIALLRLNPNQLPQFNPSEIDYDSGIKDRGSDLLWTEDLQDYLYSKKIQHFSIWSFLDHQNPLAQRESSLKNSYLYLENGWGIGFLSDGLLFGDKEFRGCSGDSGAGVFVQNPKNPKGFLLVSLAITGRPIAPKAQCTLSTVTALMTPKNVRWINSIIK